MNRLPASGKVLIATTVGSANAWDFYQNHGLILHRKHDLPVLSHVVFISGDHTHPTVPSVHRSTIMDFDPASIAQLALSTDPDSRALGIALMRAVAGGFPAAKGTVLWLGAPNASDTVHPQFQPNAGEILPHRTTRAATDINSFIRPGSVG